MTAYPHVPLMPRWKRWILDRLHLTELIHADVQGGPIYEEQLLITWRSYQAIRATAKAQERAAIIDNLERVLAHTLRPDTEYADGYRQAMTDIVENDWPHDHRITLTPRDFQQLLDAIDQDGLTDGD